MADFEQDLNPLFLVADADAETGERLAFAAMAQIEREDRRRGLILTTGIVAGLGVAALAVLRSDAIDAVRDIAMQVPRMVVAYPTQTLIWVSEAAIVAIYGAATFRPGRAR